MNKKIFEGVIRASTILSFKSINPDFTNIEDVYQNNLLLWFINNSDNVETKDGKGIKKHNNTLLNPENIVVLKTKKGFKINENDFIKSDLEYLEILNVNLLTFSEKKQFEFYRNYLNKKNTEPQPKENNKPDEVNENKHIEIFKNDSGYNIFLELHNIYKNKHNQQANYSFLFYALKKDYLVCSGASFINFLSKLNVHIDKIDSRQSGTNSKTELYNSIQKKYSEIQ